MKDGGDLPTRGKRRMAWFFAYFFAAVTVFTLLVLTFGSLTPAEADSLSEVFGAVRTVAFIIIPALLGIDAVPSQIIPALKKEPKDEWSR